MRMTKNYSRKGTIEPQMQRSIVVAFMLLAHARRRADETAPVAAGGAYTSP
jgi:hypothetical protein